jgi:excisionase family DNA binding protein
LSGCEPRAAGNHEQKERTKRCFTQDWDHFLTLREALQVLRLSPRTVREYVPSGEVEGRLIGGPWRFRRAELDAFFENAPSEWDFAGENGDGD